MLKFYLIIFEGCLQYLLGRSDRNELEVSFASVVSSGTKFEEVYLFSSEEDEVNPFNVHLYLLTK